LYYVTILLLTTALFGCTQPQPKVVSEAPLSSAAASSGPIEFNDFERFLAAAKDPKSPYVEMGYFFIPAEIPESIFFKGILVGGNAPNFIYGSTPLRSDEYDPLAFIMTWYPRRESYSSDLKVFVSGLVPRTVPTTPMGKYYFAERPAYTVSEEYKGDATILFNMVWWEQEGEFFQCSIPADWKQEEIERYCVAKKIEARR
jgi:hypothetical protein